MVKFNYYTPTEIIFGAKRHLEVGKKIAELKAKKVLIHYGSNFAKQSGLIDEIIVSLKAESIDYLTLGGVVSNPHLSKINEGIALVKENDIDFILAVGGGSVIDSAKAISAGSQIDKSVWTFIENNQVNKALPIGVILTISAAGSEMSSGSVITDEKKNLKRSFGSNLLRPKFAILNPELTYTLPKYQIACGIADTIMHTVERYFTNNDSLDLTDSISTALIKTMFKHGPIALKNSETYQSQAEIMWASSLSHNGLTGARSDNGDWATHMIGHELSGKYNLSHGESLTVIWPSWALYVYKNNLERFKKFAIEVMDVSVDNKSDNKIAIEGINKLTNFFKDSLKLKTSIKQLDFKVSDNDLKAMAKQATLYQNKKIGVIKELDYDDIYNILKLANQ